MLEDERKKVLGIERLVLETMCFKFEVDEVGPYVVKLGRKLGCESACGCPSSVQELRGAQGRADVQCPLNRVNLHGGSLSTRQ